jgi:arsenate reductase
VADVTLWHNPRCSKSRAALKLLEDAGASVSVRRYLEDAPTLAELTALHRALGRPVLDMVRTGEAAFRVAGLTKSSDDDALLQAMADHPILIERPVAIRGDRAVIGRPPEDVLSLLP